MVVELGGSQVGMCVTVQNDLLSQQKPSLDKLRHKKDGWETCCCRDKVS